MKNLAKTYDPKLFEDRIYEMWEEKGAFNADVDPDRKPFTIVMPPPNITGQLHMGHALDQTLQDILTRWKRMQGYSALWLPGSDHASIATEVKVVEKLRKEKGIDKHDITREEFLEYAWDWKHVSAVSSATPATGEESALLWMKAVTRLSTKCSSVFTKRALSIRDSGSSTGVQAARQRCLMLR